MLYSFQSHSASFYTSQFYFLIIKESTEDSDRIGAASNTGNHFIRKPSGCGNDLLSCLFTYDRLEIPDNGRKGRDSAEPKT